MKNILKLLKQAQKKSSELPDIKIEAQKIANTIVQGEHARRLPGVGEKFWQYREYQAGDRPQDIDWRQSGKSDKIYTRIREKHSPQTTILWCDQQPGMHFKSDKKYNDKGYEAKICALSLAYLLTRSGEIISYLGSSKCGRSDSMIDHVLMCFNTEENLDFENLKNCELSKNSTLVLISDFLEPIETIKIVFNSLRSRLSKAVIIQILDPAELELPYEGRVIFEHEQAKENVQHVQSVRKTYQLRLNAHNKALSDLCLVLGWDYIFHRTDEDLKNPLAELYLKNTLRKTA